MSKSIITLQLGNYANFIGSHYWNLHEFSFKNLNTNIDNDVNYYEGLTLNNEVTFTPKVLSWDWKENLGARIVDDIYEEIESQGDTNSQTRRDINSLKADCFNGKLEKHTGFTDEELKVNKTNKIINKEHNAWNEYLYARYHPKSLTKLPKLYQEFDSGNFRYFLQGQQLTESKEYNECMIEQTRYFVEKCDMLQGFQVICDSDDGFSGVGMNFLTHLSDEYKKNIISFPTNSSTESNNHDNLFNKIFLYNEMNSKSIFWSPISCFDDNNLPVEIANVNYNQSKFHTSAILAVALKSLLLPCSYNNTNYSLSDYSYVIDRQNNKMASLALSLPFPLKHNETLEKSLLNLLPENCYSELNPYSGKSGKFASVLGSIFGIDETRQKFLKKTSNGIYDNCSNVCEMMEQYVSSAYSTGKSRFFSSIDKVQLQKPFPEIFSSNIDKFAGELLSPVNDEKVFSHCPKSVPLSTMLYSSENTECLLRIYESAKSSFKKRKISTCLLQIESDSITEAIENFRDII